MYINVIYRCTIDTEKVNNYNDRKIIKSLHLENIFILHRIFIS